MLGKYELTSYWNVACRQLKTSPMEQQQRLARATEPTLADPSQKSFVLSDRHGR